MAIPAKKVTQVPVAGDARVPPVDTTVWEHMGLSDSDLRSILSDMESLMEEAEELAL